MKDAPANLGEVLTMFVIYDHPLDFSTHFVCRRFFVMPGGEMPVADKHIFASHLSLAGLRNLLPPGLVRFPRDETDDPKIIETWL